MDAVYIFSAKRTPIGAFQGYAARCPAPMLGGFCIQGIVSDLFGLDKTLQSISQSESQPLSQPILQSAFQSLSKPILGIMGCSLPASLGQNPCRQACRLGGLPWTTTTLTVNHVCGSGMTALIQAALLLQAGDFSLAVAGGMENMTQSAQVNVKLQEISQDKEENRGQRAVENTSLNASLNTSCETTHLSKDGLLDVYEKVIMTELAERTAKKYGITREEAEDYVLHSFQKAQEAILQERFTEEIVPIPLQDTVIAQDERIHKVIPEKFPRLKPHVPGGILTPATISGLADGAAAVMLVPETTLKRDDGFKACFKDKEPLARLCGYAFYAGEPEDFTQRPVMATQRLCSKLKWNLQDVDLFEVNEAFATVPIIFQKQLQIPYEKINIFGGACVFGHPLGCSGARIVVTLALAMKQLKKRRGIATICIGGGEGIAIALERP